jgi:hypothetical protein
MESPIHKRAARTEAGYFVGVQAPMCLILRKSDMKVVSCSRKKLIVYESAYTVPLSINAEELALVSTPEAAKSINETTGDMCSAKSNEPNPSHIQSIKCVSAHTIPTPHTTGPKKFRPPTRLDESAETQSVNQGEGLVVPEHVEYDSDLQLGLSKMNKKISAQVIDPGIRAKVIASLKKASDVLSRVVAKGQLKVGKKINKDDVNSCNIVNIKRSCEKKK